MYVLYIDTPLPQAVAGDDAELTVDKGMRYFPVLLSIVNLTKGIIKGNIFPRKRIK